MLALLRQWALWNGSLGTGPDNAIIGLRRRISVLLPETLRLFSDGEIDVIRVGGLTINIEVMWTRVDRYHDHQEPREMGFL